MSTTPAPGTLPGDVYVPAKINDALMPARLELQLSHPTSSDQTTDVVTRLTITDKASRRVVADIEFTAEQFHQLLAQRTPGSIEGVAAQIATRESYGATAGLVKHTWGRTFDRYSTVIPVLAEWAEMVRFDLHLHSVRVHENRNSVNASWAYWADPDTLDYDAIELGIDERMSGGTYTRATAPEAGA
jgi:hypothetical protein